MVKVQEYEFDQCWINHWVLNALRKRYDMTITKHTDLPRKVPKNATDPDELAKIWSYDTVCYLFHIPVNGVDKIGYLYFRNKYHHNHEHDDNSEGTYLSSYVWVWKDTFPDEIIKEHFKDIPKVKEALDNKDYELAVLEAASHIADQIIATIK